MQIDFHHGATYVLARLAGFAHPAAEIIAYAAQYVDDATNEGYVRFEGGQLYERIASAHKMLDYRNFDELANRHAWLPFHFLPGNQGLPAGERPAGGLIDAIVCRPDSEVARAMVSACIVDRDKPFGLHRLGVTMHVYADTWAHQGFAGTVHAINRASEVRHDESERDARLLARMRDFFSDKFDSAGGRFIDGVLPIGHGAVLSNPDLPFLSWRYVDGAGHPVVRDNPRDFLDAAEAMCRAMRRFRVGDPAAEVPGLSPQERQAIATMFAVDLPDGEDRHRAWLRAIATTVGGSGLNGFGFPPQTVVYVPKRAGSWKYLALGTDRERDDEDEIFRFDPAFLSSHWKLFHDALQVHRLVVLHEILPRFGLCAA